MIRIVVLVAGVLYACATHAQDLCQEAASRSDTAVREQYQQNIDYFLKIAAAAQSKGFDPRNFPQADDTGQVQALDLIAIVQGLVSKMDQGIAAIFTAFQECEQRVAPYQRIVDVGTFFLSGGLQQVIPKRALYIDASRLLAGTPFGGPNALVPQTREYIFSRLGIGGGVADAIRNPLQVGTQGLFRAPWNPVLLPPGISPLPGSIPIPGVGLPPLQAPKPIPLGSVGGHRVCVPWC
jgi:hypothetical protein